ncbi:hypothetical protein AMAG_08008 [Allomyces macrogynus ATCC 38327]|uniref:Uncharacterized protein n=1 Tax=Allomyces macrogynus (strain ATCC 38327) TaxID=578462 RepID=A0A0L0SK19_ALLM3|nr:hypothetical protein AMAG_08008 [Allomyces macrogynus ATCC 38327]|eukprot:KNE62831.1 hypothetical protein AMAG_08008 [Allomyces macrogynus ATCC 38327]
MPSHHFDALADAIHRSNMVADIDLQKGHLIGDSCRIKYVSRVSEAQGVLDFSLTAVSGHIATPRYGYLTLAPSSPQRDAVQCLEQKPCLKTNLHLDVASE